MLIKLAWFFVYIFKYLLGGILLGALLGMIFPPAGGILFLICILGGFSAAWEEAGNRANNIDAENEGFEEALRQARRNLM